MIPIILSAFIDVEIKGEEILLLINKNSEIFIVCMQRFKSQDCLIKIRTKEPCPYESLQNDHFILDVSGYNGKSGYRNFNRVID